MLGRMNKRLLATPLWFLTGWYIGALAALVLGVDGALAPILAVAVASLTAVDPRRIIWTNNVHAPVEMAPEAA